MVGWFDPSVFAKTARKAINSTTFGQYADRRLIHAAYDSTPLADLAKRYDLRQELQPDEDGAVWIDYVADLGDGGSTYAISYLVGQKTIDVRCARTLLRGHALIMGGDQVYPGASRDAYEKRMKRPYRFAFPDTSVKGADHPPA